ncbi:MAG: InlB B-repeat-containing protein [Clostridia bacterium]|nr:InlB B-repeat-containing protein [Clostridia bacterium]
MNTVKKITAVIFSLLIAVNTVIITSAVLWEKNQETGQNIYTPDTVNLYSKINYRKYIGEDPVDCTGSPVFPGDKINVQFCLTTDFVAGAFELVYAYDTTAFYFPEVPIFQAPLEDGPFHIEASDLNLIYKSDSSVSSNQAVANTSGLDGNRYGYVMVNTQGTSNTARIYKGEPVFSIDFEIKSEENISCIDENKFIFIPASTAYNSGTSKAVSYTDILFDENICNDFGADATQNEVSFHKYISVYGNSYYKSSAKYPNFFIRNITDDGSLSENGGTYIYLNGKIRFDGAITPAATVKGDAGHYDSSGLFSSTIASGEIPAAADVAAEGYELAGWSTVKKDKSEKNGESYFYGDVNSMLTADEVLALTYGDYNANEINTVLYAVYKSADTHYRYNVYAYGLDSSGNQTQNAVLLEDECSDWLPGKTYEEKTKADILPYPPHGYTVASPTDCITLDTEERRDNNVVDICLNRNLYEVSFSGTEGNDYSGQKYFGSTVSFPADPEKEHYTFGGWKENGKIASAPFTVTDNTAFEAVWIPDTHTVTFDCGGGSATAPVTADYGSELVMPPDPSKPGFTFDGWEVNGKKVALPYTVTDDVTLLARWIPNRHTVTFNTAGGSYIPSASLNFGSQIVRPADPEREGYTFAGWDAEIPAAMPDSDLVFNALWNINEYTVTFDTLGGSVLSNIKAKYGDEVNPSEPVRDGFIFDGWEVNGEKISLPFKLKEDVAFTARWVEITEPDFPALSIVGYRPSFTPSYRSTLIFHTNYSAPDGYEIVWSNNQKGDTCTIKEIKDKTLVINASLIRKSDNEVIRKTDDVTLNVNNRFFARIIAFIRSIFHRLPKYENFKRVVSR